MAPPTLLLLEETIIRKIYGTDSAPYNTTTQNTIFGANNSSPKSMALTPWNITLLRNNYSPMYGTTPESTILTTSSPLYEGETVETREKIARIANAV